MKNLDQCSDNDRKEELTIPNSYSTHRDKCFHMFTQFKSMWDTHPGSLEAVQQRTKPSKKKLEHNGRQSTEHYFIY